MHEAATACLDHAHRVLGQTRVLAITSPDNHASARVLTKVGMVLEGRLRNYSLYPQLGPGPGDACMYAWAR